MLIGDCLREFREAKHLSRENTSNNLREKSRMCGVVYHVDQLREGFTSRAGRKCDTRKALGISTSWFGTRRLKVQILSPRPLNENVT
jgi:hypothetical protein